VGHDIASYWRSAISLVDIGSSLWPFIHNGSRCNDSTHVAGWRPDLDMLEVGRNAWDWGVLVVRCRRADENWESDLTCSRWAV
jgi:hypothetical protein